MSRLSMDLKVMPRLQKEHWYILCIIDEITNYLITTPLYQGKSEEVGEALIENIITKFGTPDYMMMDQDSAFMSSLMSYLFKKLGITIKTVGSLQLQVITGRTWYKIIVKNIIQMFDGSRTNVAQISVFSNIAYNIFHSPNLGNYSPKNMCTEENQEYS